MDYKYDIITGTSVGALNAALMVQDDLDFACNLWDEIDTAKILDVNFPCTIENRLSSYKSLIVEMIKKGGLDYTPLKDMLSANLNEDKIRNSPLDFGIVTVEFPSFKPHTLFKEDIPYGQLKEYLLASSACFPAMRCHVIDGTQYIDGGYYDNMPVKMAVEKGADEIIAVDLDGPGKNRVFKDKNVNIRVISSPWPLGDVLFFNKNTSKKNMELGYLDTMKNFGMYEGVRYSFVRGESEHIINNSYDKFTSFLYNKFNINEGKPKTAVEEVARVNIARCLRRKWNKPLDRKTTIIASAEVAAEVFKLNPTEIYTFEKLNLELHKVFVKLSKAKRKSAFDNIQSILDPRQRVLNLARLMAKKDVTNNIRHFPGLAAILPADFIAATYINVMGILD
jgi:NTE family protein